MNTVRGAQASAVIYSITETARANGLNVYYYLRHLLTELPQLLQSREKLEESVLEPLIAVVKGTAEECYSKRRRLSGVFITGGGGFDVYKQKGTYARTNSGENLMYQAEQYLVGKRK